MSKLLREGGGERVEGEREEEVGEGEEMKEKEEKSHTFQSPSDLCAGLVQPPPSRPIREQQEPPTGTTTRVWEPTSRWPASRRTCTRWRRT